MKAIVFALLAMAAGDVAAEPTGGSVAATAGLTSAPFEAPTLSEAKGHALVFLVEGAYEVLPRDVAIVRVPALLASLAQPAGAYTDRAVLGNPQLGAVRRLIDDGMLAIEAGVEIGLPVASHDHDLRANRALAIADGIYGRLAPELFTPGVLPATFIGTLSFRAAPWKIDASIGLPLLVRVFDADMPSSTTNAVGFATIVEANARRRLMGRLTAGISTGWFIDIAPVHQAARSRARVQDLERASLTMCIGRGTALTFALQTAIGGDLGGSTFGGGVTVEIDL